jgi:hypothetical protein
VAHPDQRKLVSTQIVDRVQVGWRGKNKIHGEIGKPQVTSVTTQDLHFRYRLAIDEWQSRYG